MALDADEIALCNRALNKLGAATFASGDGSDEETQAEAHYDDVRDALLRRYPWRFACRWATLVQDEEDDSGTSTGSNTSTTLNDTDKTWVVNDYANKYAYISGGTGAGQVRLISSNTATELTVSTAWNTTPDDTSTYEVWTNVPPYPWDYQYDLPSAFLRMVETDPADALFEVMGSLLRTNESSIVIQYVRQETTPGNFDALFTEAFVAALAAELCMPLLHDKSWAEQLEVQAARALSDARIATRQDARRRPTRDSWWNSRRG